MKPTKNTAKNIDWTTKNYTNFIPFLLMIIMSNKSLDRFDFEYTEWECHGCGLVTFVKTIFLPNLCNQPLYLCRKCETKLRNTIK